MQGRGEGATGRRHPIGRTERRCLSRMPGGRAEVLARAPSGTSMQRLMQPSGTASADCTEQHCQSMCWFMFTSAGLVCRPVLT